jgi:excisionase family DNA binding protein
MQRSVRRELVGRSCPLRVYTNMSVAESTSGSPAARLDGPLLRPEEAARLLAVKRSWIYEAVRAGRLPCLRVGRHIRFTLGMLEGWLGEQIDG